LSFARLARATAITATILVKPEMPNDGLSKAKRAELMGHLAELDLLIEDQTAHVKVATEMGWLVPVLAVRLERLKQTRQLYLSALQYLLGEQIRDDDPGDLPPQR